MRMLFVRRGAGRRFACGLLALCLGCDRQVQPAVPDAAPQGAPLRTEAPPTVAGASEASAGAGAPGATNSLTNRDNPSAAGGAAPSGAARGAPAGPSVSGAIPGAAWQKLPTDVDPELLKADVPLDGIDTRGGRFTAVPFSTLAGFRYDQYAVEDSIAASEDGRPEDHIPAEIRALNEKPVAIRGFMVPIEVRRNDVRSFLLVRNRLGCCFGMQIGINEWIYARMTDDKTAKYVNDVPITAYGRLEVGEDVREGMIISIYRLHVDDVVHLGGY